MEGGVVLGARSEVKRSIQSNSTCTTPLGIFLSFINLFCHLNSSEA